MMDDILVFGANQQEQNQCLFAVLKRIQQARITLNRTKCQFNQNQNRFCRYVIDIAGIRPDSTKTQALNNMQACKNVADV